MQKNAGATLAFFLVSRKPLAVLVVPIQEDVIADQLSLFEEYDPFTGEKNKRK